MTELCSWTKVRRAGALALLLVGCGSKTALVIGSDGKDAGAPICTTPIAPPSTSLVHRYSFSGTTTTISDPVGSFDGQSSVVTVMGTAKIPGAPGSGPPLDGSGQLTLDGNVDYVALPTGIISSLTDATIMAWVTWRGGAAYQRVFDFGVSNAGDNLRSQCKSCLLIMTRSGDPSGNTGLCAQLHAPSLAQTEQIVTSAELDTTERQVALVFKAHDSMTLYLDGSAIGAVPVTIGLSEIVDHNDWLGLSQYDSDNLYQGTYDEFRIYNRALSACEIAATVGAGPDQP